jgi:uncharacterized membrane protein (DUF2068 family)
MKRPLAITIICVLGYITVLFTFPQVFSPSIKKLGLFVPAVYGIIVASQFIGCVGLWFFKRWGAELYLIGFFAKALFHLFTGTAGAGLVVSALINLVFLFFLLRYYPRMNANL